ncbi:hypothetical protein [Rubricoccus marinus]|uniref:Curlin associated repeat-containing protein n=1 Tax=Rubricoccus marinus TaxID=716817 RepID=A0A259U2K0_9BACT|nr:hypothetical protein [Rubricoccus marinus]OZC04229.1 hypothetical protein BSZ36_15320 [Rubricoccus marinus]
MTRLLPLLLFALAATASAQSEVFVEQAGSTFGVSTDVVIGSGAVNAQSALNTATAGVSPATNVAAITQEGADNRVDLTQQGIGNRLGLFIDGNSNQFQLSQIGSYNEFVADVIGDGNVLGPESIQAGTGNQYTLLSDRVSGEVHSLQQYGDANQAFQVVGQGLKPASIQQRGSGMQVMVERR